MFSQVFRVCQRWKKLVVVVIAKLIVEYTYIDGLVHTSSIAIVNTLKMLQFCAKPSVSSYKHVYPILMIIVILFLPSPPPALPHDDVIKWKHFPRCWPFVRRIHSPHKGQGRGALMFSLICVWINGWVNNRDAGDLRRYRAHCDVIVMMRRSSPCSSYRSSCLCSSRCCSSSMVVWSYGKRRVTGTLEGSWNK